MGTEARARKVRSGRVAPPNGETPQEFYDRLVAGGMSPRLADALASRTFAGIGMTDSIFMEGRWNSGGIADERVAAIYRQMARESGVSPEGKTYCSGLASFPGDPRAWVDSVADVKRVAAEKNLILEGGINYTPPDSMDAPIDDLSGRYEVADDIVDEAMLSAAEDNPDLAEEWAAKPEKFKEARHQTKELFSGND